MSEVVTVLHRFDLPMAAALVADKGCRAFLPDPVIYDRALGQGIAAPLVHVRSSADIAGAAFTDAQRDARALCRDLGEVLAAIAPAAVDGAWSGHRIFHLLWTLHGYRRIWPEVLAQHTHDHWHVLLPQQAHTYGVHSFVPGLLLVNELRDRGLHHTAYGFDCPGLDAYQLPDLRQLPAALDLIAHVPTCGHDARYIADELRASGLRVGALSPQMYDVPLDGVPASGLVGLPEVRALLGAQACARVQALRVPIEDVLRRHLVRWIAQPRFLDLQLQALWEALEAQTLFYLWLEQHFAGRPPRQLLISNHDATVHGALMTYAREQGMATLVLPHSRVHNLAIKSDGLAPLCLHHAMQDGPCLDLADRVLPSGPLRYPGDWQAPAETGELRTVGLVLNGISANGMCMVDFTAYAGAVQGWRDWAAQRGLTLKLRVRAVETPVTLVAQCLQTDVDGLMQNTQGSLLEFARGCDLTLGFDVPTSGLQDLVREGLAVMQVELRPLAWHEWSIVDERVVPRYGMVEAQQRLALMQANASVFARYRRAQFDAARARTADARPLRDWLRR
ncbi:hypothetical protein [Pelomonas cellulosilytica]|uniref:Uncharacterized protein n=1 Tax=Pelomonas cellulosilytica TaxID=2906762 RepID=A0ABS8XZL0_9BURK|nr:hypothetical protein [Pelomonas sp. P8]MCE4556123.1 hypothetical protein [Pelomonas sp. P8]